MTEHMNTTKTTLEKQEARTFRNSPLLAWLSPLNNIWERCSVIPQVSGSTGCLAHLPSAPFNGVFHRRIDENNRHIMQQVKKGRFLSGINAEVSAMKGLR